VLRLCGCAIEGDDVDRLVELLAADVTLASDEAAAAVRFARDGGTTIERLDPDIRDAILHVLADPPSESLAELRDSLARGSC
jgi:hypothetical protein